eukprot:2789082-Rhodomonas_salina.5
MATAFDQSRAALERLFDQPDGEFDLKPPNTRRMSAGSGMPALGPARRCHLAYATQYRTSHSHIQSIPPISVPDFASPV